MRDERGRWIADRQRPAGVLADALVEARYGCVPVEAFPFLDTRADGCHYALWIDDAAQSFPPCVVFISPMDPTPERVQLVAATAAEAVTLLRRAGYFLEEDVSWVTATARRAVEARAPRIVHPTVDRLGVVCAERPAETLDPIELRAWADEPERLPARMATLSSGLALAALRDLIADHDAAGIETFAEVCARTYGALGRTLHTLIAQKTYGRDPEVARLLAELTDKLR